MDDLAANPGIWASQNLKKPVLKGFPKRMSVDTYASRPVALGPGSPSQEVFGRIERRPFKRCPLHVRSLSGKAENSV
jgi:hypothetical protein